MKKMAYNFLGFVWLMMNCLNAFGQEVHAGSTYTARDFSFLLGKVQGLNDSLLSLHFKLYEGYVKNTNMLIQTLDDMRNKGEDGSIAFGALKKSLSWEFDGMRLHELYFESLGQPKPLSEKSKLYQAIVKDFG